MPLLPWLETTVYAGTRQAGARDAPLGARRTAAGLAGRAGELLPSAGELLRAQRLEHHDGQRHDDEVHHRRDHEHHVPASGRVLDHVRDRHEERRRALRRVQQAQIGRAVLRPERVGASRREQAEDLAPGQEDERGEYHERPGGVAHRAEQPVADQVEEIFEEEVMTQKEVTLNGDVLIVDDDPDTLFTLNEIVTSCNCNTIMVKGGKECLEAMKIKAPDLILLDIMMPGMDGFQTLNRIKQNKAWQNIPVFAVTAKAMVEDKEIILKHGFDDYISKPVNSASIAFKIERLFFKLNSVVK